jgi:hypothetical protein
MMGDDHSDGATRPADIVPFPHSRVTPGKAAPRDTAICYGGFARMLGIPHEQTTGHWCSRCNMIWYGYLLEVTCPMCGNRHG